MPEWLKELTVRLGRCIEGETEVRVLWTPPNQTVPSWVLQVAPLEGRPRGQPPGPIRPVREQGREGHDDVEGESNRDLRSAGL